MSGGKIINPIRKLAEQGKLAGLLIIVLTMLSLLLSNLSATSEYTNLWHRHINLLNYDVSVLHIINDGLMVVFFLMVGMEIKRELYVGELANKRNAMLPVIAAFGGMIVPGIIYAVFNIRDTHLLHGWAIPTATDIAFSLGVLSMLGNRVPFALKVFLTALAIIDDLGAIIIIALFYTEPEHFHLSFLISSLLIVGALMFLSNKGFFNLFLWIIAGIVIWYFMLLSGVHTTIAGVLIAFTIPLNKLASFENKLQLPVNYFILPAFALANTAIVLSFDNVSGLFSTVGLGVSLGLLIGKPLGITLASWVAVKNKWCLLPGKISLKLIFGAGLTAGIGFTMSIFITSLSFKEPLLLDTSKIAIIAGSVLSGLAGVLFLKSNLKTKQ